MNTLSTLPYQQTQHIYLWLAAAAGAIIIHLLFFINYQASEVTMGAQEKGLEGIEIGLKKIYQPPAPPKLAVKSEAKPFIKEKPKLIAKKKPKNVVKKKPKSIIIPNSEVKFEPQLNTVSTKNAVTESTNTSTEETVVQEPAAFPSLPSTFGAGNPNVNAAYEAALLEWLERYKRYPSSAKRRGQQGKVGIQFTIDQDGNVLSLRIIKPSPFTSLNKAALKMVKRASPLPAVPKELRQGKNVFNYTIPVAFLLK